MMRRSEPAYFPITLMPPQHVIFNATRWRFGERRAWPPRCSCTRSRSFMGATFLSCVCDPGFLFETRWMGLATLLAPRWV
jgi:hypothetical protein